MMPKTCFLCLFAMKCEKNIFCAFLQEQKLYHIYCFSSNGTIDFVSNISKRVQGLFFFRHLQRSLSHKPFGSLILNFRISYFPIDYLLPQILPNVRIQLFIRTLKQKIVQSSKMVDLFQQRFGNMQFHHFVKSFAVQFQPPTIWHLCYGNSIFSLTLRCGLVCPLNLYAFTPKVWPLLKFFQISQSVRQLGTKRFRTIATTTTNNFSFFSVVVVPVFALQKSDN
eukprot:TRINITY_DN2671_c0_g1_i4.p1 TRINITY_DN2671_c0_g1~~TRINITY_DN2671_c0_g1_i4.p1  ORF type:complete len:224 (+),score=-7.34 TRINITY_DN2671_c0_g1_i4:362-1033(+)